MTLDETLLQNLANWRPAGPGEKLSVAPPDSDWKIEIQAQAVDGVGARLWEVVLDRRSSTTDLRPLEDQAQYIASRVTGLLEPLRVVEIDILAGLAQLRSEAPATRGASRFYYEVVRHTGGRTEVRRFESAGSARRERVLFSLTHEAIAKLATDLASA
ncbi:MAG: hypothetical protein U0840_15830 [Gemmataceae bacterium]